MRWIWVDRILEIEKGERCVAIKNVSSGEDVLYDHFPATERRPRVPVLPHSLVIEGMAQTAGVLVGYTGDFKEKVVLAKIGKAIFHRTVRPGFAIRFTATLERFDVSGAATRGHVDWIDPATGDTERMAEITLMFSHIDRNRSNLQFPEHNFVFTGQLMEMIQVSGVTDARVYDAPQNPVTL